MKVENVFTKIAKSNAGQRFYQTMCNPKNQHAVTTGLLAAETILSTANYMIFTQKQENIPPAQKKAMQTQHVLSCLASLAICTPINKKVGEFAEKVAQKVDKNVIEPHKVQAGIGILGPTLVVLLFNRCILPAILTPISSKIRDRFEKKEQEKKLNIFDRLA